MCILSFETPVQPLLGVYNVVLYLSCIWLFYGWCGLFHSWQPGNPGFQQLRRQEQVVRGKRAEWMRDPFLADLN